jgi:hypothetical protein
MNERRPATAHIKPFGLRLQPKLKDAFEPTEKDRRDFDEWEAELIYMRRALDVLRQNFMNLDKVDPEVERDIQELEAEEQREAGRDE